jgi:hypothetical protein
MAGGTDPLVRTRPGSALSECFADRFNLGEQEDAAEAFESVLSLLHNSFSGMNKVGGGG